MTSFKKLWVLMVLSFTFIILNTLSFANDSLEIIVEGNPNSPPVEGEWEPLEGKLDFNRDDPDSPEHIRFVFPADVTLIDSSALTINGAIQDDFMEGSRTTIPFNAMDDISLQGTYIFSEVGLDGGGVINQTFTITYHTLASAGSAAYQTWYFLPTEIRSTSGEYIVSLTSDDRQVFEIGGNTDVDRTFGGESRTAIHNIINNDEYSDALEGYENIHLYGSGAININDASENRLATAAVLFPAYPTNDHPLSYYNDFSVSGREDGFTTQDGDYSPSIKHLWETHEGEGTFGAVQNDLRKRQIINFAIENIPSIIEDPEAPEEHLGTIETQMRFTDDGGNTSTSLSAWESYNVYRDVVWTDEDEPYYPDEDFEKGRGSSFDGARFLKARLVRNGNIIIDDLGSTVNLSDHSSNGNFDGFSTDNPNYTIQFIYEAIPQFYTVNFYDSSEFDSELLKTIEDVPRFSSVEGEEPDIDPVSVDGGTYYFTGWTLNTSSLASNLGWVTADIDAHANYTYVDDEEYLVTFKADLDGDEERLISTMSVVDGESIAEAEYPSVPEYSGYNFTHWDGDTNNITEDTMVYARHETEEISPNTHTVTFKNDIDPSQIIETRTVEEGESIDVSNYPDPNTSLSYTFVEWVGDTQNITEDQTVIATHLPDISIEEEIEEDVDIEYTVTFRDSEEFDYFVHKEEDVVRGGNANPPSMTNRTHEESFYRFSGWDGSHTNITSDIILTAEYDISDEPDPEGPFIVRFFDLDKEQINEDQEIEQGGNAIAPTAPDDFEETSETSSGNTITFTGNWSTDFTDVQRDLNVFAEGNTSIPVQQEFTVTFIDYDDTVLKTQDVIEGNNATPPKYPFDAKNGEEKIGSNHTGWDSNNYINVYQDETIQAQYQSKYYDVTFDANGGNFVPGLNTVQEVPYGDKAYKLAISPNKSGSSFTGWYTDEETTQPFTFNEETGESTQLITEDITLYAGWETEEENTVDITFDANGGDFEGETSITNTQIENETIVMIPEDPEKDNHIFTGWYTDEEADNEFDFDTLVTEDITLYAGWTDDIVSVTFNANGGTFSGNNTIIKQIQLNDSIEEIQPSPTKSGHMLIGWYIDIETNNEFDFNTPVTENITLYAGWDEADCDFTWEVELPFNYFRETLRFNRALRAIEPPDGVSLTYCREIAIRAFHRAINEEYIKDIEQRFTPIGEETSDGRSGKLNLFNAYHQFEQAFLHLNRIVDLGDDETYKQTRQTLLNIKEDMEETYNIYLNFEEGAELDEDTGYVTLNRDPATGGFLGDRIIDNYNKRSNQYLELLERVENQEESNPSPFTP